MRPFPLARDLARAAALLFAALFIAVSVPARADAAAGSAAAAGPVQRTLSLLNAQRRQHRLPPLRANPRLAHAALRHGRDMVRHNYFAHVSLGGTDVRRRIARTGYLGGASRWMIGENLAWGAGTLGTPSAIVAAWMRSPGHRANILRRGFREIGIAVVGGAPVRGIGHAATYVTDFGVR